MNELLFQSDYPLTSEQVAFFRENGYVRCDDVLNARELEIVRHGMDKGWAEWMVRDLADGEDGRDHKDRKSSVIRFCSSPLTDDQ